MDNPPTHIKTRCPKCGKLNDGAFCIICGTPASMGLELQNSPAPRGIIPWFRSLDGPRKVCVIGALILAFLLLILVAFPARQSVRVVKATTTPLAAQIVKPSTIRQQPAQTEDVPLPSKEPTQTTLTVRRIDPPKEAQAHEITNVLRQAKLVGIFCGDDVDQQTCKLFALALRSDLASLHVAVEAFYQPEIMVQSFYVPPMPIPFTDVTLRLIESNNGPHGAVQVHLGGSCFDSHAQNELGFQLPIWAQVEGGGDTGPLETDKAQAASKLAQAFSAYWEVAVK
jgi:hypothetical protein